MYVAAWTYQVRRVIQELQESQVLLVQLDRLDIEVRLGILALVVREVDQGHQEEEVHEEVLDLLVLKVGTVKFYKDNRKSRRF